MRLIRLATTAVLLATTSCSGNPLAPGADAGADAGADGPLTPAVLTASPLPLTDIIEILSIGNLAPPDHTLPMEHAYLVIYKEYTPGAPGPRLPVFAPGSGTVTRFQIMSPNSYRIDIAVNSWLSYYMILFDMDTTKYRAGRKVTAGEQLGVTTGHANTLDLGVINKRIQRSGFARLERYQGDTRYIDSPFRYFAEPVRSAIYGKVNREGGHKDGTLEIDVVGTLAGVWYLPDAPLIPQTVEQGGRAVAFAPDVRKPTVKRVSIGYGMNVTGLYGVQDGARDFASVTVSSGPVGYRLDALDNSSNPWRGVLMTQLVHRDTLQMEFFPGSTNLNQPFTVARTRYVR